ncbi:hypothetical protein SeMB42_g06152 [Synchytrium endobioticum]|uniref:KANL3/Tex30 alpha/beta hydrolase-like domain-containing protein n=1 Tax=Synchytrium endobioticum TaxID=286115 RepID=A0A507CM50_9FUNG|nr:hypothetical protein SeLEV6574_g06859 [Synchytrium endobioticum]TPX40081.1 hypothetical protein SeMB42_g06158 [Synchytrium endobioticum]TPX40086.1 hypothetical protein SeMB42_g06155 [Synchytrium endobioticum]TPX40087.1 hypothetical protein SeMB42_g06152 [Synchytrium endobioticum]
MSTVTITIPFEKAPIAATVYKPQRKGLPYGVILSHGAGGDHNSRGIIKLASALSKQGFLVVAWAASTIMLDRRVKQCTTVHNYCTSSALSAHASTVPTSWILAGRSMGARVSCSLAADIRTPTVIAVLAFSYPLHTESNPTKLRDELLINLPKPVLMISGTSDDMCDMRILQKVRTNMSRSRVRHWLIRIDGANCSGNVQGGVKANEAVLNKLGELCASWVRFLVDGNAGVKAKWEACPDATIRAQIVRRGAPVSVKLQWVADDKTKDGDDTVMEKDLASDKDDIEAPLAKKQRQQTPSSSKKKLQSGN